MNTRDLDEMQFKRDPMLGGNLVKSGSAWVPYGRVLVWCRRMGEFRRYGEWAVQETSSASACRGTVRARLNGPRGAVEAWNNCEVFYIPKGVKPSKLPWPECEAEDAAAGIVFWPELPFDESAYEGRSRYGQHARAARERFGACVREACAMAGVQERLL